MLQSLKSLIVILLLALVLFRLGKPIALRFSTESDFLRRRNVWLALTVTAFLSPSIWIFMLVAIPVLAWAGRKDTNPIALYLLLLQVVPPISVNIPVPGINDLFTIDNFRLLSFCVLIPTAWRLRKSKALRRTRKLEPMDFLLLAFGALQVALFIPPDLPGHILLHDSPTNALRRAFLFFIDDYMVYYVVRRSCISQPRISEAQAAFCLSCAIMAAVAAFESARHWLLYADLTTRWNEGPAEKFYLFRGDSLRAEASAGTSLSLGYLLAIAFGFWLSLRSQVQSVRSTIGVVSLLWLGLLASYSRGPWVGGVFIYFIFIALRPRALPMLLKAIGGAALVGIIILQSPMGERITRVLPIFGGSIDSETVDYRQRLAARSWELISQAPFFGDQLALFKMEDLRQGAGIIDLVNTYANVTLFYGFAGLSLFLGFILVGAAKAYGKAKTVAQTDPSLATLGFSLVACILGALLMLSVTSFDLGCVKIFYVLAAFAAAFARIEPSAPPSARINIGNRGFQEPR